MHPETCPCCYENGVYEIDWPYVPVGETPLEPAEGCCSNCGFRWHEHCRHPEREQVLAHREWMKKQGANIDWNEIEECDIAQSSTSVTPERKDESS